MQPLVTPYHVIPEIWYWIILSPRGLFIFEFR
jgi:hypothetical protein